MKHFKRSLTLIIALICILLCCSCNETPDETEAHSSSATESVPSHEESEPQKKNEILRDNLSQYKFVVSETASSSVTFAAEGIILNVKNAWQIKNEVNKDSYASAEDAPFEILVGNTNRPESQSFISTLKENEGGWAVIGSKLVIAGYDDETTVSAAGHFYTNMMIGLLNSTSKVYISDKNNKTEDFTDLFSVMSFNVFVGSTDVQARNSLNLIRAYNPDIFGVQEVSDKWKTKLKLEFKSEYEILGIGRESSAGAGEATQIFIRKDKFQVLSSGTSWLTATPDKPSAIGGSLCKRIATYAVLQTKDGKVFNYVNTHLDHAGDDGVRVAQVNALNEILKAKTEYEMPTIITGDFNTTEGSSSFSTIASLGYKPTYETAEKSMGKTVATFPANNSIIDFCFVSNHKTISTKYYRVGVELKDGTGSDHRAIYSIFKY